MGEYHTDLEYTGWECVDWICLIQSRDR